MLDLKSKHNQINAVELYIYWVTINSIVRYNRKKTSTCVQIQTDKR